MRLFREPSLLDRRRLLGLAAGVATAAGAPAASAAAEPPMAAAGTGATSPAPVPRLRGAKPTFVPADFPRDDPAFNVLTVGKLQGDLSGATTWTYNPGFVYAVVPGQGLPPGEFGQLLFEVEGCTQRISRRLPDGSVEERSRNWMFYRDADSGAYLEKFRNPLTGAMLDVPPWRGSPSRSRLTANGPVVDFGAGFENTALGRPLHLDWRTLGETTWIGRHAATRLRDAAGRVRNEMSIDAWVCRTRDVTDTRLMHIPSTYAWTSFGEWQVWLGMGTRPGNLLWRIESSVLHTRDALPPRFLERMQQLLPGKLAEPLGWEG